MKKVLQNTFRRARAELQREEAAQGRLSILAATRDAATIAPLLFAWDVPDLLPVFRVLYVLVRDAGKIMLAESLKTLLNCTTALHCALTLPEFLSFARGGDEENKEELNKFEAVLRYAAFQGVR